MKRAALIFLLLACVSLPVLASPAFGVRGGLNLANWSVDPKNDISWGIRTGIAAGGNIEFSLSSNNKITLRGEAMYVMKGSKATGTVNVNGVAVDLKETEKVDELVLAPFLVFRFPSDGFTPFLEAGPELGLNISHSYNSEYSAPGYNIPSESGDIKDWAGTDFGLNFGAGIAIPAGDGEVLFDARYNLGLSNMYDGSGSTTIKNNGIQLLIGYNIKVPTK